MGIDQAEIDNEIECLKDIYTNLPIYKKILLPQELSQQLNTYIDNYHIFSTYREIANNAGAWLDILDDFRANSKILPIYLRYAPFLEDCICPARQAEVFANIVLAASEGAVDNYIAQNCQNLSSTDQPTSALKILTSYIDNIAVDDSKINYLRIILQRSQNDMVLEYWRLCQLFVAKHIQALQCHPDVDLLISALYELDIELQQELTCIDALFKASNPKDTVTLINSLYRLEIFVDKGKDDFLNLIYMEFLSDNPCDGLLKKTVTKLLELRSINKIINSDLLLQIVKYADTLFNDRTYELWQYVPNTILDQLYQSLILILNERDIDNDISHKYTILVSSLLEIDEVMLSNMVLMSGEYDEHIFSKACVDFMYIGVSLRDLDLKIKINSESLNLTNCFKYLPFLIRANLPEYNNVIIEYCKVPAIHEILKSRGCLDGISVVNILDSAKKYNEDIYIKIFRLSKPENIQAQAAYLQFTLNSPAKNKTEVENGLQLELKSCL